MKKYAVTLTGHYEKTISVYADTPEQAAEKVKIILFDTDLISFSEEEDHSLITIENSGDGLKEEELPHIFDAFYRGSNHAGVRGSGLGLYICKELLHKMDGDIYAKRPETGFAVTIVLRKM